MRRGLARVAAWLGLTSPAGEWLPGGVSGIGGFAAASSGAVVLVLIPAVLIVAGLFGAGLFSAGLIPEEAELRVTTCGSQTDANHRIRFYEKGRRCPSGLDRLLVGGRGGPVPAPSCSVLRQRHARSGPPVWAASGATHSNDATREISPARSNTRTSA